MVGADLRGADLAHGDHSGVDLTDADLSGAKLDHADMRGAVLTRTRFDGASLDRTKIEMMHAPSLRGFVGTPDYRPNGEGRHVGVALRWRVNEHEVRCGQCGHTLLIEHSAQLHSAGLTFLNLEWLGTVTTVLECASCSHLEWFVRRPAHVQP